uniref:Uncharacterized protein n=1 Tax=Anguilla anguilla TaxID=7936 RepID=A0A0E9VLV0_ANGAN
MQCENQCAVAAIVTNIPVKCIDRPVKI